MPHSGVVVHQKYTKVGILPDYDCTFDIVASLGGLRQRRGHSFHNGLAVVIDILTGLP